MLVKYRIILTAAVLNLCWLASCDNAGAITDTNQAINARNWSYVNRIKVPFVIDDLNSSYGLYINLRHTGDYRYSNIFLRIHTRSPNGKVLSERKEFRLALPDGQWLGTGTGNLYQYQLPLTENYQFAQKGQYVIEIEQNMRDNPLKEITDVGLRIKKNN